MATVSQVKDNLTAMLHGGSLNKVRDLYSLMERAANTMLARIDPIETMRTQPLSQTVHDALFNYSLPTDYKKTVDLYPQADRSSLDRGSRVFAEPFDAEKLTTDRRISIEGNEGSKIIRINWRVRTPKVLNTNDSLTGNGTWSAVGSATGVATDTIYKYSGGGSIKFNLVSTGDGIQNTTMTAVDLTSEDEVATVVVPVYLPSTSGLTSISARWGNDLTTNYWSSVAQTTQADGTAFRVGWNIISFPWSTATETGTVTPSTIDSFRITFAATSGISKIRVDNILFSIGFPFDIKYYSQYLFKNSSGTYLSQPTADTDTVTAEGTAYQAFLLECLTAISQQLQGSDSTFDVNFATSQLSDLYKRHRSEYPSQSKKASSSYFRPPVFRR
jgi:hypothetical protein